MASLFLGLLILSTLLYTAWIGRCLRAWQKVPELELPSGFTPRTFISVVVPVRDEEESITDLLQDFAALRYPPALFEVLVVDDHSRDRTARQVQDFAQACTYQLRYLDLRQHPGRQGKKAAIQTAVEQARGDWVVGTDGDCRVQPDWLALMAWQAEGEQASFISGPVAFHPPTTLFQKIQQVEFAALVGVGAASIFLGRPNMCNGANVGFRRAAFAEVGGYAGNEEVASGDDEFLMHKIFERQPNEIKFLKARSASVLTEAMRTGRGFLRQRVRWASKWPHYRRKEVQAVAFLVFWVNLLFFVGIPLALLGFIPQAVFCGAFAGKILVDFVFLSQVLRFFDRQRLLVYALPLQLVYIPYVVLTALAALGGNYEWKGRKVR